MSESMTSLRLLRFEVPSRESLDRLATGQLPGDLRASAPRTESCRDVYFDTLARDLERRGVTVRVRIWTGGKRTLAVDVREREEGEQIVRSRSEAPVDKGSVEEILAGDSEPARLLQAMIEP